MKKTLAAYIGLATLVCSGLLFVQQYGHDIQKASAQNDDQHFKDCRSRILESGNRASEALDRAERNEDVTVTEFNSIVTEAMATLSNCEDIQDRLIQDPAIRFHFEVIMPSLSERAEQLNK